MNVKRVLTSLKILKVSNICFYSAALLTVITLLVFQVPNGKLEDERAHLALRSIGDELLKANGDYSTPVLPVQRNNSEGIRLEFSNPVMIDPDKLVDLSSKYLTPEISHGFIVKVLDSSTGKIVYGFEIDHSNEKEIPCLGRVLPKSNYTVELSSYDSGKMKMLYTNVPAIATISGSIFFLFLGMSFSRKGYSIEGSNEYVEWNNIQLNIARNLVNESCEGIQLTIKESQILKILLEHDGNLVSRDHFIQQIWSKEGVVTDRSLDMYISRLRKKLSVLPSVQIANQHSKGYYLKHSE